MGVTKNHPQRAALSLRALAKEYGLSRGFLAELVNLGEIPAIRRGRAILVLRSDFESWWRAKAAQSRNRAENRVDEVLHRGESR
ncbi:MAG: helix-turn-helix domain-containing protein [bacterium]|nr:helix-turn-helix domain-containing protein [bacterium]